MHTCMPCDMGHTLQLRNSVSHAHDFAVIMRCNAHVLVWLPTVYSSLVAPAASADTANCKHVLPAQTLTVLCAVFIMQAAPGGGQQRVAAFVPPDFGAQDAGELLAASAAPCHLHSPHVVMCEPLPAGINTAASCCLCAYKRHMVKYSIHKCCLLTTLL